MGIVVCAIGCKHFSNSHGGRNIFCCIFPMCMRYTCPSLGKENDGKGLPQQEREGETPDTSKSKGGNTRMRRNFLP